MSEYLCPVLATSFPLAGNMLTGFLTKNAKPQTRNPPKFMLPKRLSGLCEVTSVACMGYGSSIIYRQFDGLAGEGLTPLALYGTTLMLGWSKTPLYMKTENKTLMLIIQIAAFGAASMTFTSFYKANEKAAYLMLPYVLWVFYKTCLQMSVCRNKNDD